MLLAANPSATRTAKAALACALALALGVAPALSGCAGNNAASGGDASNAQQGVAQDEAGYTFTDDLGREVRVTSHERVVAGMGSFADIWELAGGTLVGASDDAFADYDIDSKAAKIGDFSSLNTEAIIALEPDFVILTGAASGRGGGVAQTELASTLEAANIPCAYFTVTTFDDYLRMLKTCCDITGDTKAYEENGAKVAARIDKIKAKAAGKDAGSAALLVTYSGGTRVQNSSSQTGAMLAELGAANIADANQSLLSDYSLESLVELDPKSIFLLPMGDDTDAAQRALKDQTTGNPAWKQLSAVKEDRVFTLDPELFLYKPNSDWDEAYEELYEALYGGEK